MWVMAAGALVGALAALPLVAATRRERPSVPLGLAAVLLSFSLLTGVILLVRMVRPDFLVSFAIPSVLAFLATVSVAALRRR